MGGRGASSGVSNSGKPYGTEYKSFLTVGNIKFVVGIGNNNKVPMETMTRNRVYVTLRDPDLTPKSISYYDQDNKRKKQIDLDHEHQRMQPHMHHGYEHNEYDTAKGYSKLTPKEIAMVERVYQIIAEQGDIIQQRYNRWRGQT